MAINLSRLLDTHELPQRAIRTWAMLSLTTLGTIAAVSAMKTGSGSAAVNAISHCVYGDEREFGASLSVHETLVGAAVNTAAMAAWVTLYELIPGRRTIGQSLGPAIVGTGLAYVIDYHVVPKRYSPGIERVLSRTAVAAIYGVFASTLVLSTLWNRPR